nr:MAG TPA: hypothetical protein [Caudoviricetes sp.]
MTVPSVIRRIAAPGGSFKNGLWRERDSNPRLRGNGPRELPLLYPAVFRQKSQ